jgi:predicted RNA-binding Zn-ribbon protein involved in translation (DUF1610 family)
MSFKDKPLKKINCDNRVTIDVLHNDIIKNYSQNENKKNELLIELQNLKLEYENNSDERILIKIDKIKEQLKNYNENEKNNYYLDNGELLSEYYDSKINTNQKSPTKKNLIMDLMMKKDKEKKLDTNKDIINEYICKIDNNKVKNFIIEDLDICKICNEKLTIQNTSSSLICENCGYTEHIIINSEKMSYKDPPRETSYFAYKRINHFNEWLAQFQAKETTDIPEDVYTNIIKELKKDIFLDINNLKVKQVRDILKKLKYNKYYEHVPHIINIINGKKSPVLTRLQEEQLRMMFKEIQIPFMNNCPETRSNFLSYSYVLHKFCELLELDHLLIYFPLLKSREKLQQQDKIWEKMCKDLKWQYIPSI